MISNETTSSMDDHEKAHKLLGELSVCICECPACWSAEDMDCVCPDCACKEEGE